ncbi:MULTISPECIES: hypothetical protein [Sphingomonas]|uniref:hypothetical protein n=1 Tax=Sphingomonas TaxID=13687 RepID=UPI00126A0F7A|nr:MULTISPECIES: hypothetical protein [Sphingomonas]
MSVRAALGSGLMLCGSAASAGLLTTSGPGVAWFEQCDGYGKPTENGDGMTKEASGFLGIFTGGPSAGNTRRSTPAFGAAGVQACDTALADPRLRERYWARRTSLLMARAVHGLADGKADGAIADLDKAQAAVQAPNDPYYQRSLGLGLELVRAYALRQTGQEAKARELAADVLRQRPWSRATGSAMIAIVPDEAAVLNGTPMVQSLARLQPKFVDAIFQRAMTTRDFATAIRLYPNLVAPTRTLDRGTSGIAEELGRERNEAVERLYSVRRRGALAYALAATGDATGARRALADGDAELAQLAQPLPPLPEGEKEGWKARSRRAVNEAIVTAGQRVGSELAIWRAMTESKLALRDGKVPAALDLKNILPNGAGYDLLLTYKQANVPDAARLADLLGEALKPNPKSNPKIEIPLLFASLPHAEIPQRIATYRKANSDFIGYLWGGTSGFKTKANADGTTTISFTGQKSSGNVVEEMALLRAADYVHSLGRDGFVIRSRADFERTIQMVGMYSGGARYPDGYSTELTIEPVDVAHPSPALAAAPWRIIKADEIISALGPTYFAPQVASGTAN